MDIHRNIANILRLYMTEHHKTLVELAEELEISRSSLQQYVKGKGNPSIDTIARIAQKMGINPVVLLTGMLDSDQREFAWAILTMVRTVGVFPKEKKLHFAQLFLEMIQLWQDDGQGET